MNDELLPASEYFSFAVDQNASDIHIKAGAPIKFRINGEMIPLEMPRLTAEESHRLVFQTMSSSQQGVFGNRKYDNNYAYIIPGVGRFRVNAFLTRGTYALAARYLPERIPTLDELGVAQNVRDLMKQSAGLIVVCGATGSGKSTLMAALIDEVNQNKSLNIISVEDPIEFIHQDKLANVSQREVGEDVPNFESAIQSSLREDPDILLLGETRSSAEMKAALYAAETGHLVVTTLHTNDAVEAIARMMDLLADEEAVAKRAIAVALRGVVAQRLVPSLDGRRTAVNEVLINTPSVAEIIAAKTFIPSEVRRILDSGASQGMRTFEESYARKVAAKEIALETALTMARRPDIIRKHLRLPPKTS